MKLNYPFFSVSLICVALFTLWILYTPDGSGHKDGSDCYFSSQIGFDEKATMDKVYTKAAVTDLIYHHIEGKSIVARRVTATTDAYFDRYTVYEKDGIVYAEPTLFSSEDVRSRFAQVIEEPVYVNNVTWETYIEKISYTPVVHEGKVVSTRKTYPGKSMFVVEFPSKESCDAWIVENVKEEYVGIDIPMEAEDYLK